MSGDCAVTPRTQKRRDVCQRRVDYFLRNGSLLGSSNGSASQLDASMSSSLAAVTPKTPQVAALVEEFPEAPTAHAAAAGIPAAGRRSSSSSGGSGRISDVHGSGDADLSDTDDDGADEPGFRTHRPLDDTGGAGDIGALAPPMPDTSRSTELLVESQRDHLRDVLARSLRHSDDVRPHATETGALVRDLERRHAARRVRRYPDYDAIIRDLDSELSSQQAAPQSPQSPQQQPASDEYLKHFDAVKRHHEELQRRAADEWAEQKLRESNSRATLERYFQSLRRLSPRSAGDIAREFEPVPDTARLPELVVRCPDCGEAADADEPRSWCYNCGCCLVGCQPQLRPDGDPPGSEKDSELLSERTGRMSQLDSQRQRRQLQSGSGRSATSSVSSLLSTDRQPPAERAGGGGGSPGFASGQLRHSLQGSRQRPLPAELQHELMLDLQLE